LEPHDAFDVSESGIVRIERDSCISYDDIVWLGLLSGTTNDYWSQQRKDEHSVDTDPQTQ
jgi:hypothetical protein